MASIRIRSRVRYRNHEWSFTWDPDKAAENFRKHGVTFLEAASAFLDPHGLNGVDPPNEKLIAYQEHLLLTVYVGVEGGVIRIISAWRATKAERKKYEQGVRTGGRVFETDRYRWRLNPYAASIEESGIVVLAEAMPKNARSHADWMARPTRPRR